MPAEAQLQEQTRGMHDVLTCVYTQAVLETVSLQLFAAITNTHTWTRQAHTHMVLKHCGLGNGAEKAKQVRGRANVQASTHNGVCELGNGRHK